MTFLKLFFPLCLVVFGSLSLYANFSIAAVFDVNCDEQEGLAEAIHALQVTAGIVPGTQSCGSGIVLDGLADDWSEIEPLKIDPQGDDSTVYDGDDLKAVSITSDDNNLYLLLELYENANQSFGNGPPPSDGSYRFSINGGILRFGLAFEDGVWAIGANGSNDGDTPASFQGDSFVKVLGKVIEIMIPWSELSSHAVSAIQVKFLDLNYQPTDQIIYP